MRLNQSRIYALYDELFTDDNPLGLCASVFGDKDGADVFSAWNKLTKNIFIKWMKEHHTVIYDMDMWKIDNTLNAADGQEISEDVYNEMMNVVPPLKLPASAIEGAREFYSINITAGFLAGEPATCDNLGLLYRAFGTSNEHRYYYLGLLHHMNE